VQQARQRHAGDGEDLAIVTSIALQYGGSIGELRHSLTHPDDGNAAGPLGAAIDAIAWSLSQHTK